MGTELERKKKEEILSMAEKVKKEHEPAEGDIYVSTYSYTLYRLGKMEVNAYGGRCFPIDEWSFAKNEWEPVIEGGNRRTLSPGDAKQYYTYVMHDIGTIMNMADIVMKGGELPDEDDSGDVTTEALTTQRADVQTMLDKASMISDRLQMVNLVMKCKVEGVKREMEKKMNAIQPMISSMMKKVRDLKDLISVIQAYIGETVNAKCIVEGESADISVPITIRQRILYMDEEMAVVMEDGQGLDHEDKDKFFEWLKTPAHRDLILPEEKCVVVMKPKRYDHMYSSDSYENSYRNRWNHHSFVLMRNGENIYSIESNDLCIYGSVMPTRKDLEYAVEMKEKWNSDSNMESIQKRGVFFSMLVQGIVDRTEIFSPHGKVNILKNEGVNLVFDMENEIGTGIKPFRQWIRESAEKVKRGDRVIYFGGGEFNSYYENDFSKPSYPEYGLYSVDMLKHGLGFLYLPNDMVWKQNGMWGGTYMDKRTKRVGWIFDKDSVINYDAVTSEELQAYLDDRTQRSEYTAIIPLIKKFTEEKKKEEAWESAFKSAMRDSLLKEYRIEVSDEEMDEAVEWWKMKVIFKRPLKSDDSKSWRMIEKYLIKKHVK